MKRLIIALSAAIAVSVASAALTDTQSFEGEYDFSDFTSGDPEELVTDLAAVGTHESAPTQSAAPAILSDFGQQYLSLDTGDVMLWRTNTVEGDVYLDMSVQFLPSADEPELEAGTKIAVYQDSDNYVVVKAGDGQGGATNYVTDTQVAPETWARLSISATQVEGALKFKVYVNGTAVEVDGAAAEFPSITADTTIVQFGFSGTGALDSFVARTTDPYLANPAVSIGGEGYATLEEAVSAAGDGDVIDLLANNAEDITLTSGQTFKLRAEAFTYYGTVSIPDANLYDLTTTTVDGVTTYTAVGGTAVATITKAAVTTEYNTLQKAIAAAVADEDVDTVKLVADPSGAVNIPAGITVDLAINPSRITGLTELSGSGDILVPGNMTSKDGYGADHSWAFWLVGYPDRNLPMRLRGSTWAGTVVLSGSCDYDFEIAKIGNANSKVRFNGFTTMLYGSGHGSVGIELVGDGLTIYGSYESARTYTIGGAITGSGALALTDNTGSLLLSGDVSGFTGNVTASGTSSAITFGNATTGSGQRIVVGGGETVTNAADATWTAANLIVLGNLTVDGTLSVNDGSVWCSTGTGVIRFNNASTALKTGKFADSWNGTYVVGWNPDTSYAGFVINDYAISNKTIEIAGDSNGAFTALPATAATIKDATAPTVAAKKVVLTANWTINNGWTVATTTFDTLSGSGNLTVNGASGSTPIPYAITMLDGYTGTLGGNRGAFTIGKVNVAEAPAAGARVVKVAKGVNGSVSPAEIPLYVAGVDSGEVLVYKADGAQGEGLYVYVEPVAQIEGGASYASLSNAVAEAQSGDVITLLGDLTLDARVEPNLGSGTTLAFNLDGHTLSRTGTGGNGSVIDVKSGSVIVTNGVIDCTQDDAAIVKDGVYAVTARSGSSLTLDDVTVTVDSKNGACVYPFAGATVSILGGTYANLTDEAYQYRSDWQGMAVNQANKGQTGGTAQQLITITGGRFKQVDPALGDDSWADGEGSFLAPNYVSKLESGYWVVSAKSGIDAGESETVEVDTSLSEEDQKAAAIAQVEMAVTVSETVAAALTAAGVTSSDQQSTYQNYFTKEASEGSKAGEWVVTAVLDEAKVFDSAYEAASATTGQSILDTVLNSTENPTATIQAAKPGLYYSIEASSSLQFTAGEGTTEGVRVIASGTTVQVAKPSTIPAGSGVFFRVKVSTAAND